MKNDFIFTQTKETKMTKNKTVTIVTEKLETVDISGRKQLRNLKEYKNVDYNDVDYNNENIDKVRWSA